MCTLTTCPGTSIVMHTQSLRYILIIYVYHLHICHIYHAYVICIMLLACILYTPTIYVCCITTTLAVPLRCASVAPSATVHTTTHATTQPVAGPAPRRVSSAIVILTPHLEWRSAALLPSLHKRARLSCFHYHLVPGSAHIPFLPIDHAIWQPKVTLCSYAYNHSCNTTQITPLSLHSTESPPDQPRLKDQTLERFIPRTI